jgi:hypothetical protein
MTSHALEHPQTTLNARWLIVGFISGALAVLIFHQAALAVLHALDMARNAPYSPEPTRPWGIPQMWSIAFWGGVWGVILALAFKRLERGALIVASVIFGAIFPTLVAWFVVAPLKGQPVAAGFVPMAMMVGPIVNAAWGLGAGIGLALFGRSRHAAP